MSAAAGNNNGSIMMDFLLGDTNRYSYGRLCRPQIPCIMKEEDKTEVPFYELHEPLPLALSMIMGLQHAFAMVGGLITVPFVVFRFSVDFGNTELQQYAISASLIACGLCTIINIAKLPIPGTSQIFGRQLYLGSGVLSVMGISFTFLPIFQIGIDQQKQAGVDGVEAYGNMLGTAMVCGLSEIFISILPGNIIQKIFPPVVSSVTVMLLGIALTGTGMKYWGGGVVCAEMIWKEHGQVNDLEGLSPIPGSTCLNGEVALGYGSTEFIGLGFSVMIFLVLIEMFGSVFMKNCNVVIALLFGYMIAGLSNYQGAEYVDSAKIDAADPITFLWVHTFPIGFYAPAVIPMLIGFLVTTTETVGDLAATYEVSDLRDKEDFDSIMQGGLLSDAICSILSTLFTSMPNTTFSQNNGVIALTKCASRRAGYACGGWLIFLGVFSKVAGVITSIPDSVLGGMTIFLFANVLVSGISMAINLNLRSRRIRFIMALSLAVGVGVTIWPFAFQDMRASNYTANFWRCENCNDTLKGIRNGVSIFLSTGYCIGTIIAMILNLLLPDDPSVVKLDALENDNDDEDGQDAAAAKKVGMDSTEEASDYDKAEIAVEEA